LRAAEETPAACDDVIVASSHRRRKSAPTSERNEKPTMGGGARHVSIKAYKTMHDELTTVELTTAARDDVIVTSSHRHCMDEHVDRV
jgi:hypothetical protein